MISPRRPGAALILALLAIIVLDCIVLGTLHLAIQEHRLGANRSVILQLRLNADGGIRRALGSWTVAIDTLATGSPARTMFPAAATPGSLVSIERLDDHLFLIESVARQRPPQFGRASARMLVHPPALPPAVDPAPAPVSSAGRVRIGATGSVSAHPPLACAAAPQTNSILAPVFGVTLDPGASVDAPAGLLGPHALIHDFLRLKALALPRLIAQGDSTLHSHANGVLIVDGSVTLSGGAAFTGLLVTSGSVTVEHTAALYGAVHAGAGLQVAGRVQWDPCVVMTAIEDAGLDHPEPAGTRRWLPGF